MHKIHATVHPPARLLTSADAMKRQVSAAAHASEPTMALQKISLAVDLRVSLANPLGTVVMSWLSVYTARRARSAKGKAG